MFWKRLRTEMCKAIMWRMFVSNSVYGLFRKYRQASSSNPSSTQLYTVGWSRLADTIMKSRSYSFRQWLSSNNPTSVSRSLNIGCSDLAQIGTIIRSHFFGHCSSNSMTKRPRPYRDGLTLRSRKPIRAWNRSHRQNTNETKSSVDR